MAAPTVFILPPPGLPLPEANNEGLALLLKKTTGAQDVRFTAPGSKSDLIAAADARGSLTTGGKIRARRPVRGIQIKEDTYCSLRIISSTGKAIFQIDASGDDTRLDDPEKTPGIGKSFINTNFIAQVIQEERIEKTQIIETFGEPFLFVFGERPRFIQVSGYLLNTVDFNWRSEWWDNYENRLRGTKLVEQKAKVFMTWDDIIVEGYILQANAQDVSTDPYRIPFSYSFFLTGYRNIGIRGKIPVGFMSPIERLQNNVQSTQGNKGGSFFSNLFKPETQDKINLATGVALDVLDNPVRAALAVTQSALGSAARLGLGAVENALRSPSERAALRLLRGGIAPHQKFGPLRNNYDEFLNTELDVLDIPTLRTKGIDSTNFIQRLINFVPGLNNPRTLNRVLASLKNHKTTATRFSTFSEDFGKQDFSTLIQASFFGSGASSSPLVSLNASRTSTP